MSWTTPRVWVAGEQPTAALMNAQIRDDLLVVAAQGVDEWAAFNATWTGSISNPNIGDGSVASEYCQLGKLVVAHASALIGSTFSSGSGTYSWALPQTAEAALRGGGVSHMGVNATDYTGVAKIATTTTFQIGTGTTTLTYATPSSPDTWSPGDRMRATIVYEAA